ncbi:MAG: tetratricopeptide repeat protein [Chitinispirillales bacterium]|jgi:tetratricopeptide (TPR) repeat protein|nr:tetratricopeptide repeat protein [Chitinispirillales bacterium]
MKKFFLSGVVITVLAMSSALFAQSTESLMNAGNELLQRGAFDQAVTQFRQIVSREPRNFEAQYNLAFAYLGWGRNSNAVDEFRKALSLRPNSSHAWGNLAIAYENQGKTNDAINALSNAVKYDPNNITARINLASMYANTNRLNQAINAYMDIVKSGHRESNVMLNLAKCLISANRIEEAKNYLRESIAADPSNVEARWELADIFWKREKEPAKAINELKLAISVRPDVGSLYDQLAGIFESEGQKPEAVEQLKKALVYTTDVLAKERIQARIDRLEGKNVRQTTGSAPAPQMKQMRREDESGSGSQRRVAPAAPVKVDFGDLLDEEEETKSADPMGDLMKKKK